MSASQFHDAIVFIFFCAVANIAATTLAMFVIIAELENRRSQ